MNQRSTLSSAPPAALAHLLERYPDERCYALVDAARKSSVYSLLCEFPRELCSSLYQGETELAPCAPHLVAIEPRTRERVVSLWNQQCVVFVWSREDFAQVRRHFRKFLLVKVDGKQLYFRFYDPRVLRVFLPSCTEAERAELHGSLRAFMAEAPDGASALLFETDGAGGLVTHKLPLVAPSRAVGPGFRSQ